MHQAATSVNPKGNLANPVPLFEKKTSATELPNRWKGAMVKAKAEVTSVLDAPQRVNAHEALKGAGPVSLPPAVQTVGAVHSGTIRATIIELQKYDTLHGITHG